MDVTAPSQRSRAIDNRTFRDGKGACGFPVRIENGNGVLACRQCA